MCEFVLVIFNKGVKFFSMTRAYFFDDKVEALLKFAKFTKILFRSGEIDRCPPLLSLTCLKVQLKQASENRTSKRIKDN